MNETDNSLKRTARIAGILYLANAVTSAVGIMIIPARLTVPGDMAATAQNILDHEFLFRFGVFNALLGQVVFIFLGLVLYRLFENVSRPLARSLVALVTAAVPVAFLIIFTRISGLHLLKDSLMTPFGQEEVLALAVSRLHMVENGMILIGIFWGLWLFPFGLLVYRSGFIPGILGILLIAGGVTYLVDATAFILFPGIQKVTNTGVAVTSSVAELSTLLWLIIKGTRTGYAAG